MKHALPGDNRKRVGRRFLAGAALVALVGFGVAPARAEGPLMIVYVAATDCPPCQVFEAQDWPRWQSSSLSRQVKFVKTTSPKTTQAYQAKYWPSEARPFLSAVKVPVVPSFILVHGGSVVLVGRGLVSWRNQMLPELQLISSVEHHRRYGALARESDRYESSLK